MNLNDHIEKIVEGIVADITANVLVKLDSVIFNAINARLATHDFPAYIQTAAISVLEKKASEYTLDPKKLETKLIDRINETINNAEKNTNLVITESVKKYIDSATFDRTLNSVVGNSISSRLTEFVFPENSINSSAIKLDNFTISGDNVVGGLIQNFSSTGIDDRATQVAVTILDEVTVVENNLHTKDLTVEGSMTINGDFTINGTVPEESKFYKDLVHKASTGVLHRIDTNLLDNFSRTVFEKIRTEGLDLSKITVDNFEVIKDNTLGSKITESNLQKLGLLKELQVSGETLIAESFYVTKGRVGINTIEPSAPLAIWDDEIEITAQKRQKDTGSIGTPRQQKLILFANNQDNITLEPDGSVTINDLRIGPMRFTASDRAPNYVSERNHVVWNTNPNYGGPLGWVCLGGSNWANFGIID